MMLSDGERGAAIPPGRRARRRRAAFPARSHGPDPGPAMSRRAAQPCPPALAALVLDAPAHRDDPAPTVRSPDRSRFTRLQLLALFFALGVLAIPIIDGSGAAAVYFPNHLARMHVIAVLYDDPDLFARR